MKVILSVLLCLVIISNKLTAQSVYMATEEGGAGGIAIFDLATCQYTTLVSGITPVFVDFVEVPGGFVTVTKPSASNTATFYFVDPGSGTTTFLASAVTNGVNGIFSTRLLMISPTEVLCVTGGSFYLLDLTSNTITTLAIFPLESSYSLYEYNGVIYYIGSNTFDQYNFYTIQLTPTFQRTFIETFAFTTNPEESNEVIMDRSPACDVLALTIGTQVLLVNPNNNTTSIHCSEQPFMNNFTGATAPLLNGTSGPNCNCTGDAGTWDWSQMPLPFISTILACAGSTITVPHNGDETLGPGQNLAFVLIDPEPGQHFYNQFTSNNIVSIYDSNVLTFIPGVTIPGEEYWVIPVLSDAPPGSINMDDPCRDIQFRIRVRWFAPSVNFTQVNAQPCAPGQCRTLNVSLQGTPPFSLVYEVVAGGNPPQVFNVTFNTQTGTIQVCPPAGFTGNVQINALSLTDGTNCNCSN